MTGESTATQATLARKVPHLVVPLLVSGLLTGLFVVDAPRTTERGGDAAAFIPADGRSDRLLTADASIDVVEHAQLVGIEGILSAPETVAASVIGAFSDSAAASLRLWRETLTTSDGDQYFDLYAATDAGVVELAAWGGPVGFSFEPALIVLADDLSPGSQWSQSGSALGEDLLTYESSFEVREAPALMTATDGTAIQIARDCILVEGSVLIEEPSTGPVVDSQSSTVWCPGRGRVFSRGTQNGEVVENTVTKGTLVALADQGTAPSALSGLHPLEVVDPDPFFGESAKSAAVALAPAVTANDLVVFANEQGEDVHAWEIVDEQARLAWTAHPGGVIVSLATIGATTVVSTSQRETIAYDSHGRRIWSVTGAELALASAVAVRGDALIARRDGDVQRVDPRTGAEKWRVDVGADVRSTPVAVADSIYVADERERLIAIDAATGAVKWRSETGSIDAIAADGETVFALTYDGNLVALDAATGDERWDVANTGSVRGLEVVGRLVVAATDESVTARDSASGRVVWSSGGVDALASSRGGLVATSGSLLSLMDESGTVKQTFDLGAEAESVSLWVVGDVIVSGSGAMWRWSPLP